MADKTYNIVPNSDTVIILRNPIVNFAVWDKGTNSISLPQKREADVPTNARIRPQESVIEVPRKATPQSIFGGKNLRAAISNTKHVTKEPIDERPSITMPQNGESSSTRVPMGGIHYRVSSAHLKSASKTFEKALSGDWTESIRKDDGRHYVIVHDWDEAALLTLLNIVHLKNRQITRKPDLDFLAKMAVLVDYYGCNEAVEMYSDTWVNWAREKSPVPTTYCRELILWLCVSAVFRISDIFKTVSNIAIHWSSDGSLRSLELPIPSIVVTHIEQKRSQKIKDLIDDLHVVLELLGRPDYRCPMEELSSFMCSSLLLGAMTKNMIAANLLVRPQHPYEGFTVNGLRKTVQNFRSICLHTGRVIQRSRCACDLATLLAETLRNQNQEYYLEMGLFECFNSEQ